jgi:hypothetical protein
VAEPGWTEQTVMSESLPLPPILAQAPDDTPTTGDRGWPQVVGILWAWINSPWPLAVLSLLLVGLIALALVVPQLPVQLRSEPSAAERWYVNTAAPLGGTGALLRNLGFYNILQSPVLIAILALLCFVLIVQTVRLLLAAHRLRRIAAVFGMTGTTNGEPVPVLTAGLLLRWRRSYAAAPLTLTSELQRLLDARLRNVDRRTVRVAAPPLPPSTDANPPGEHVPETTILEERLLAVRGMQGALLRPLLLVGMLSALGFIWLNVAVGWEFAAPALVPGERAADAVHNVRMEYRLTQPSPNILSPVLQTNVGSQSSLLPLGESMQTQMGSVDVQAQPGIPSLVVRTLNDAPLLARPGQVNTVSSIGLGFPSAGSEETLVLPHQAIGLRIVRLEQGEPGSNEDGFLVEIYEAGSENAVTRVIINGSQNVTLPAVDTSTGQAVVLALVPLPGIFAQVREMPSVWLVWLAAGLLALGALGFWLRPGFVLAQVGPWPEERAVLTVQSDLPEEMASLRRWYTEQQQLPGEHADSHPREMTR